MCVYVYAIVYMLSSEDNLLDFGVGCSSVCCEYVLLPLGNKEADLANSLAE